MGAVQRLVFAASLGVSISMALTCKNNAECNEDEYCSDQISCMSCVDICNVSSHNYDKKTCDLECLKYQLSLFAKKSEIKGFSDKLDILFGSRDYFQDSLSHVKTYVGVSILFSTIVFIFVLATILYVFIRYQRMRYPKGNNLKKKKMESVKAICVNDVDGGKKLKLEMPEVVTDTNTINPSPPSAKTAMTPLSTRHPSEDATLEYAYDNPALTNSPTFSKSHPHSPNTTPQTTRTETSF